MTRQNFTLLTLAICMLTVNVFAQKNATIQPQAKEIKPLYQQVTKNEAATKVEKPTTKVVPQPRFGSIARPNIYKNLDANIQKSEQKITVLEADPNHDENTLIKHKATLERLQKIKAEKPEGY